jgi:uncharacterized damage-inducible protein DinB
MTDPAVTPYPSPTEPLGSPTDVLLAYLTYERARLIELVASLDEQERSRSRLPSGWTPLELLKHLTHVERRWLEWGFTGERLDDPWGDRRDDRWFVAPTETFAVLLTALNDRAERSHQIISSHALSERGQPSERWDGAEPATLDRIVLHLIYEYARHLGHLDIVCELVGVTTGE